MQCAEEAVNHGQFVSCVALLTNEFMQEGIISGLEKATIQTAAALTDIFQ
jgi:hypothetical protein